MLRRSDLHIQGDGGAVKRPDHPVIIPITVIPITVIAADSFGPAYATGVSLSLPTEVSSPVRTSNR